ncbi:spermine oxidase-like isoform X2 [Prorops nasuta]|uniref:spermine oxidase-like isoform X2 n=1 Tax=Prorops nasuta TaxID=863751 RepID=UPI0034CFDB23
MFVDIQSIQKIMQLSWFVFLFILVQQGLADENSPKIAVIGAGPSGISAASKLLDNGFENVIIIEAENRIGGRVHTTQFGNYVVDLGAQWVHGEVNNVVFNLAEPLGLLEHVSMEGKYRFLYDSSGIEMDPEISKSILAFYQRFYDVPLNLSAWVNNTLGEFFNHEFETYFAEHPEINQTMKSEILYLTDLIQTSYDSSDSWDDVSIAGYWPDQCCEGDILINWKERGYGTILEILMKKIPDPTKELPVLNKTLLNTEVKKIDYTDQNGKITITTSDGKELIVDHVIFTPSLGVLKANYETLFTPPLSNTKVNSIKGVQFGVAGKLFLSFDEPWWDTTGNTSGFLFLWSEQDKKELEADPEKRWMLSLIGFGPVQYKPQLLLGWVSGKGMREMEKLPKELVYNHTMGLLYKFLGKDYNITEATDLIRSKWYSNPHFKGVYSYRSPETEKTGASAQELSEPIVINNIPRVMFAGEATNPISYSTVHGAIETGWREAERLINLYKNNKAL